VSSEDGKERTKDEGHYKYEIGEVIMNRYKVGGLSRPYAFNFIRF